MSGAPAGLIPRSRRTAFNVSDNEFATAIRQQPRNKEKEKVKVSEKEGKQRREQEEAGAEGELTQGKCRDWPPAGDSKQGAAHAGWALVG